MCPCPAACGDGEVSESSEVTVMSAYRSRKVRVMQVLGVLLLGSIAAQAQIANFVDDFDGPTLDPGWTVDQPTNHVGFTGTGLYEMDAPGQPAPANSASLQRSPGATHEDFTADLTFEIGDTTGQNVDYKFRFWAPQFIEIVANAQDDNIRVYSGELGQNIGNVGVPLGDGDTINLRLSYDADTGSVKVGYSTGADPLELLASATGLANFQVTGININVTRNSGGPFPWFPSMFLDRFEIQDEVAPITLGSFEDSFDGPTLDPSWDIIQSTAGDHVGFVGGGLYEVQKTTLTGEAGLSREFGGQGDFSSSVQFRMQDFIGSDSRVEFRNPAAGGGITVILDSAGDVRVESEELAATVADLAGFSYQDGETLKFSVATDSLNGFTEVGLQRNGGAWLLLASLEGLNQFTPDSNETVLIKSGVGNGNTPRLQFDHYYLDEGFAAVPLEPFTEHFTGPALDSSWFTSDTGTGSLVGFNQMGQYEISPAANATAGLSRFIGFAGDATFTLKARLADFMGTDSEVRFGLTGGDALTVVLRGDDTIEIFSDEWGSVYDDSGLGLTDGDLVTLQLTIETEFGDWEFGLGINADPEFVSNDLGYSNLNPTRTEIVVARGGGGSLPSILLDQTSVNEGFALIPQAAETFSDDFNAGPLDWTTSGITHLGYTNSQWYAIRVDSNASVNVNRQLAPGGYPGVPVGSFSAFLDVRFDELVGSGAPGAGTDFKLDIEGGNLMQLVFNSFRTVRFYTQNNGATWFQTTLTEFNDGDTVNFGIVYDASGPSVTMSVGLNGTNMIQEIRSNLVGVAPEFIKIDGFRFNFSNPDLGPTFLLDQLDINPGLAGVQPGRLTLGPSYNGLMEIIWDVGMLKSATDLDGMWNEVVGATSPYLHDPSEGREFFQAEN